MGVKQGRRGPTEGSEVEILGAGGPPHQGPAAASPRCGTPPPRQRPVAASRGCDTPPSRQRPVAASRGCDTPPPRHEQGTGQARPSAGSSAIMTGRPALSTLAGHNHATPDLPEAFLRKVQNIVQRKVVFCDASGQCAPTLSRMCACGASIGPHVLRRHELMNMYEEENPGELKVLFGTVQAG